MTKSVLTVLSILLFMSLILTAGCSKDKDKVDQLEREAMETAADKATADSAAMLDSMTMEEPVAKTPQDELSSRSYESPGSGGFFWSAPEPAVATWPPGFLLRGNSGTPRPARNVPPEQTAAVSRTAPGSPRENRR